VAPTYQVVLILSLLFCAPAKGEDSGSIERRIHGEISQRHPGPNVPEFWKSLPPEAGSILVKMYDKTQSRFEKMRLLEGLGYFTTPEVQEKLQAAEKEWKSNNVFRRQVAESQIRASSEPVATHFRWLGDDDKDVRAAALRQIQEKYTDASLEVGSESPSGDSEVELWTGRWVGPSSEEESQVRLQRKGKLHVVEVLGQKKEWISLVRDFTVHLFRTKDRLWLEVRDLANSRVFIGSRELKSEDVSSKQRKHGYRVR
jgi:hypothetical protein